MAVILYLIALLLLCWAYGFAVVIVLQRLLPFSLYQVRAVRYTLPVVGYVIANLIWWFCAFVIKVSNAVALSLIASVVVAALALLVRHKFSRRLIAPLLPRRSDWPALVVLAVIAAFGSWTIIAAGIQNYFLFNDTDWFNRVVPAVLNHQNAADIARMNLTPETRYAKDAFHEQPIQVSSLMLWELMLGRESNDCALLQAVANLMITGLGAYWLSRYFFRLGTAQSAFAGIFGVVAQLYFHTYLDGHIGSTIYSSVAPYFFGIGIWALVYDRYRATLLMLACFWVFLGAAYSLVANLIVLPLIVGKLWLLYVGNEARIVSALNTPLKGLVTATRLRIAGIAAGLLAAGPLYVAARAVLYPNRIGLDLMGYLPFRIILDPQFFSWFTGLRLRNGFGYGFVPASIDLQSYDKVAAVLAIMLLLGVVVGIWRLLNGSRERFYLAMFLILFPVPPIAFALLYPFTYVIYKMIEVHYFLIVIGGVFGFQWLIGQSVRRRLWPVAAALWCLVSFTVGLNLIGSIMNGRLSLERVLPVDMADFDSLARKIKTANISPVTAHLDSDDIVDGVVWYGLSKAGIIYQRKRDILGQPSVTAQNYVFSKVAPKDIALRSDRGKYVLSYTPESTLDVYASLTPERINGILILWMSTELNYNILNLEPDLKAFATFLKSQPGQPLVYNDLSDSGYYMAVNYLFDKYGIAHSDDPRQCAYVFRLAPRLEEALGEVNFHPNSPLVSFLVAGVEARVGQRKVVSSAYRKADGEVSGWSGELFQAVEVPQADRVLSVPHGMDVSALISVLRNTGSRVANEIPQPEYERYFLDDRLRSAGILPVHSADATAALVAVPAFLIDQEFRDNASFRHSILWQGPGDDYKILLVSREGADAIRARETGPMWSYHQPLRTLLQANSGSHFAGFRTFRKDGYVRLIVGTGPSLPRLNGTIRVVRRDGRAEPLFFKISDPTQILLLPIKHFAIPGEPATDIVLDPMTQLDKRVMPYDDRLLTYILMSAELSKEGQPLYSDHMKRVLRTGLVVDDTTPDIIDPSASGAIAIGAGWYPAEHGSPSSFRWMSHHSDLVFESAETRRRSIVIMGQPGSAKVTFVAQLNGVPVYSQDVVYAPTPSRIVLNLDDQRFKHVMRPGQNVITLSTMRPKGEAVTLTSDPRELDFRVFHVGFSDGVEEDAGHPATSMLAPTAASAPGPPN